MSGTTSGPLGSAAVAAITAVQTQAAAANALTFGSGAFVALVADVAAAQAAIGAVISAAESGINNLGGTTVAGSTAGLAWMLDALADTGNLANAVAANGPLGRIATNLANAST
jgi:hypothetical protein